MNVNELIVIFKEEFEIPNDLEIDNQSNFRDSIVWSSMNALFLIILIENEYDIILTDIDLKKANTFQELYDIILLKKSANE